MAICSLSVNIKVKRRWNFWPCLCVAKLAVMLGMDCRKAASWLADNCMTIEFGEVTQKLDTTA
jgi:hypothetical protein|tara:strand:+ start:17166 stop:17354 length:189 start_codon:yes stop_codon:yes gene_type:complete